MQAEAGPEATPTYTNKRTYALSYHVDVTGSGPVKAVTSGSHKIDDSLTIISNGAAVTIGENGQSTTPVNLSMTLHPTQQADFEQALLH